MAKKSLFSTRPARTERFGPLVIELWRMPSEQTGFKRRRYAYRMWDPEWDKDAPIFEDKGFMESASPKSWEKTLLELLYFLTLSKEDTPDEESFAEYTPRQLKWRDERAEDLHSDVETREMDLEELAEREEQGLPGGLKQDWSPRDPYSR